MKTLFLVYGTIICLIFAHAMHQGYSVSDVLKSGKWGPHGPSAFHK